MPRVTIVTKSTSDLFITFEDHILDRVYCDLSGNAKRKLTHLVVHDFYYEFEKDFIL